MKQKIVVKVQMNCEKCRTKVLQIAAVVDGVDSVALEGAEKDKVVVIGDGVDSIKLTACLRKKVGHADIISVEEVKKKEESKPAASKAENPVQATPYYTEYPQFLRYEVFYEPRPGNCCQM